MVHVIDRRVHFGQPRGLLVCGGCNCIHMSIDHLHQLLDRAQPFAGITDKLDSFRDGDSLVCDQPLDLLGLGNDGKTLAGLARAGGFDTGIKGKQVSLERNFSDDLIDLSGGFLNPLHRADGVTHHRTRLVRTTTRIAHHVAGFRSPFRGCYDIGGDLFQSRCCLLE
jgi:hypothetical protein